MSLYSSREPFQARGKLEGAYSAFNYSYERPQNNPTNPILTDIRKNRPEGVSWAKMLRHYNWVTFAAAHYITEDWERITDEDQIDHARKVLTHLAALEKEES